MESKREWLQLREEDGFHYDERPVGRHLYLRLDHSYRHRYVVATMNRVLAEESVPKDKVLSRDDAEMFARLFFLSLYGECVPEQPADDLPQTEIGGSDGSVDSKG